MLSALISRQGLLLPPLVSVFYLIGLLAISPVAKWHYIFPIFVIGFLMTGALIGFIVRLIVILINYHIDLFNGVFEKSKA